MSEILTRAKWLKPIGESHDRDRPARPTTAYDAAFASGVAATGKTLRHEPVLLGTYSRFMGLAPGGAAGYKPQSGRLYLADRDRGFNGIVNLNDQPSILDE